MNPIDTVLANPGSVLDPDFDAVADAFAQITAPGGDIGAAVAVTLEGEIVVNLAAGVLAKNSDTPFAVTTPCPVFSCSKPMSGLAIAALVADGLVTYDTPVADLWPAFGAQGKDRITVAQALSHQAGVPGIATDWSPDHWFDADAAAARVADAVPLWEPGEGSGYHPITWGVIAQEIAKRASGQTIGTILRERLHPAGAEVWIGLPEHLHEMAASPRKPPRPPELGEINPATEAAFLTPWYGPSLRDMARYRSAEFPAANTHASALSLARAMEAYARGGQIGSTQVIPADIIGQAMAERVAGPDRVLPYDLSFGVGLIRNRPDHRYYGPSPRAVGHLGFGGSTVMADPDRGLALSYVTNTQSHQLVQDDRAKALIAAVYGAL